MYGRTSLTLQQKDVAERFREIRDGGNYTTSGLLRRMIEEYEDDNGDN